MTKSSKKRTNSNKKDITWEDNKNIRLALICILIISIGVLLGSIGYTIHKWNEHSKYQSRILSVYYVNSSVQITSYGIGMNGDTDSLKFGKVSVGGGGERGLNISSAEKAIVNVTITGDMAQFLTVDKNEFIIQPNTADSILFLLDVPEGTELGNYTCVIRVIFLKP